MVSKNLSQQGRLHYKQILHVVFIFRYSTFSYCCLFLIEFIELDELEIYIQFPRKL